MNILVSVYVVASLLLPIAIASTTREPVPPDGPSGPRGSSGRRGSGSGRSPGNLHSMPHILTGVFTLTGGTAEIRL